MSNGSNINIKEYTDVSGFLKDYLEFVKKKNSLFSLSSFAKNLKISKSLLSQVIAGISPPSKKFVDTVAEYFKLNESEKNYLILIAEHQSAPLSKRGDLMVRIKREQYRENIEYIQPDPSSLAIDWKHLLLVSLTHVENDYDKLLIKLANNASITRDEARGIIKTVEGEGLIKISDNQVTPTKKTFIFNSSHDNNSLKMMHTSYLDFAKLLISKNDTESRFSVSEFIKVPKDQFHYIRKLTEDYLDRIAVISSSEKTDNEVIGISLHINRHNQ